MQRFATGLVYHKFPSHTIICALCAAAWEERFVGVSYFNSGGRKIDGHSHVCPRCLPPLTLDFVMEQETTLAAIEPDDTAAPSRSVTRGFSPRRIDAGGPAAAPEKH